MTKKEDTKLLSLAILEHKNRLLFKKILCKFCEIILTSREIILTSHKLFLLNEQDESNIQL